MRMVVNLFRIALGILCLPHAPSVFLGRGWVKAIRTRVSSRYQQRVLYRVWNGQLFTPGVGLCNRHNREEPLTALIDVP